MYRIFNFVQKKSSTSLSPGHANFNSSLQAEFIKTWIFKAAVCMIYFREGKLFLIGDFSS